MKLQQLTWLRLFGALLIMLIALPHLVLAQETVTVSLEVMGASGVSGTAKLVAVGDGTEVTLAVEGLVAKAEAQASMQAGSCTMPSASFVALPKLTADANGKATATGTILFRGTDKIALETMADGEHIIAIQSGEIVACGVIPKLTTTATPLPATGGTTFPFMTMIMLIMGGASLTVGLLLWQHRRTQQVI